MQDKAQGLQGERDKEFISLHRLLPNIPPVPDSVQGIRDAQRVTPTPCPPLMKGHQESTY